MKRIQKEVEQMGVSELLEKAKGFHGHICPYLSLGLRASALAMEELGVEKLSFNESVGEKILAIAEANNCFTDGVQIATGCTLGNNCLIYMDLGKNALTLTKRDSWEAVRVYIDRNKIQKYFSDEEMQLFRRVVTERKGDHEERIKLGEIWERKGYDMLDVPKKTFKIERLKIDPVEIAPIFESLRCASCDEFAMETRIKQIDGKPYCLKCAKEKFSAVLGRGIVDWHK
jgi:formylmethanofuran dehydrogenase subunit E